MMSSFQCVAEANNNNKPAEASKLAKTLPTGIPPHAQLAPPATQRHILRYLMSAVARGGPQQIKASQQQKTRVANKKQLASAQPLSSFKSAQNSRLHRPLPVLPGQRPLGVSQQQHKNLLNCSDESLYYSGLQARVPKQHFHQQEQYQQHKRPLGPYLAGGYQYPITKSAINAILTDFNLQSHNQFNYMQHYREQANVHQSQLKQKRRQEQPLSLANLKLLSSNLSSSASALVQNGFRSKRTG